MPSVKECVKVTMLHRARLFAEASGIVIKNCIDDIAEKLDREFGNVFGVGALSNKDVDRLVARIEREEFSIHEDVMDGSAN